LLCSDLDRTLLLNGPQPESPGARERFVAVAARPDAPVVYVTGRHRELIAQAIDNYCLPLPDYVIGDVGSSLFAVTPDGRLSREDWQQEIAPDWAGLQHAEIHTLLADFRTLRLQETAKQNTWKLSYYVPLYADNVALLAEVGQRLERHAVNASLIWSVDEPAVLVANASPEVREAALQGHADARYIARGGYLGMNGNYSAGLLEGLAHFMPHAGASIVSQETGQIS